MLNTNDVPLLLLLAVPADLLFFGKWQLHFWWYFAAHDKYVTSGSAFFGRMHDAVLELCSAGVVKPLTG